MALWIRTTGHSRTEIVLPGGAAIADLTTRKDELVAKRDAVQDKLNDKEIARGDIDNLKPALLYRSDKAPG